MDVEPGGYGPSQLVVRAKDDPVALLPSVRAVISRLDATVPLYNIQTFDEITATLLADRRFAMIMLTIFAGLGFVLAIVGLYGVLSYLVQMRTREIGIRLAIGASHSRIRRQVLGNGLAHAALGILLGGGVAAASFRVVASRVPGLGAPDPAIISGVAMVIAAVAVLATWIPAARATRIDPALTLRAE
jgi:ABC-type antimicrobial peptide transport system permease subunit